LTLVGLCLLLFGSVSPARADTIILHPIADTTGVATAPGTQFGTAATITSGTSESNNPLWVGYLKFDLSSVGAANITSAVLSLYQVDGYAPWATAGAQVYRIANDAWTEAILTWNNMPVSPYGPGPYLFGQNADSGLYRGWSTWTWTPTLADPTLDPSVSGAVLSLFVRESFSTTQAHSWLSKDYVPDATYGPGLQPVLTLTTDAVPTVDRKSVV
jgi:hypothetical protein